MIVPTVLLRIPQVAGMEVPERVRQQSEYARRALRRCAALCGAPEEGWHQDTDGAPMPQAGYYWSVAHKRQWAGAVIADTPVGIDLEVIAPRRRGLHDKLAGPAEWDVLGSRSWGSFLRLWTAKEATLKANGMGIGHLAECRLVEVPDDSHMVTAYAGQVWLVEHRRNEDHIAAVALSGEKRINWCVCHDEDR